MSTAFDRMKTRDEEKRDATSSPSPSGPTNQDVIDTINAQTTALNGLKSWVGEAVRDGISTGVARAMEKMPPSSPSRPMPSPTSPEESHWREQVVELLTTLSENVDGERISEQSEKLQSVSSRLIEAWNSENKRTRADVVAAQKAATDASAATAQAEAAVAQLRTETDRAITTAGQTAAAEVTRQRSLLEKAEATLAGAQRGIGWSTVARIATALIPTLMTVLIVGSLLSGAWQALGVAPIMAWVWSCFATAHAWWAKILIALAGIAGMAGLVVLSAWIAHRVQRMFSWSS